MEYNIRKKRQIVDYITYLWHPVLLPLYMLIGMMLVPSIFSSTTANYKIVVIRNVFIISVAIPLLTIFLARMAIFMMREHTSQSLKIFISQLVIISFYVVSIVSLNKIISLRLSLIIFGIPVLLILISWLLKLVLKLQIDMRLIGLGAFMTIAYLFSIDQFAFFNMNLIYIALVSAVTVSLLLLKKESVVWQLIMNYIYGVIVASIGYKLIFLLT